MSARGFRLAMALFLVLSGAVAGNLVLLQPAGGRGAGFSARGADHAAAFETSALKDKEATAALRTEVNPSAVLRVTAPGQPVLPQAPITDSAETTRAVQRELQARGYEVGTADGVAGLVTQAAIMAYEADHGRVLTAEPSDALLQDILLGGSSASRGAASGQTQQSAKAERLIRSVQQALAKLGYAAGKLDGRLGEGTIKAIRDFEKQQGLSDSGRISGPLVARLTRLAGEKRLAGGR